jgi:hypothetical protein
VNYEEHLDLNLTSAEWTIAETTRLVKEYKACRTENCKMLVEKKMRAIQGKLNYESKIIKNIIGEAEDEGLEF